MKKQILFLIIINNLIVASVSQYSYRILGMGKEIIDFTSDSYSDIYYNPAYLYNENYNNIFSNLSNINKFSSNSLLSTEIHQIDDLISLPSNLVGFTKSNKNSKVGFIYSTLGYSIGIKSELTNIINENNELNNLVLANNTSNRNDFSAEIGGRTFNFMFANNKIGVIGIYDDYNIGLTNLNTANDYDYNISSDGFDSSTGTLQTKKFTSYETGINNSLKKIGLIIGSIKKRKNNNTKYEISKTLGFVPNLFSVSFGDVENILNRYFFDDPEKDLGTTQLTKNNFNVELNAFSIFLRYRKSISIHENKTKNNIFYLSANVIPFEFILADKNINESNFTNSDASTFPSGYNEGSIYREISIDNSETNISLKGSANIFHSYLGSGIEFLSPNSNILLAIGYKLKYYFVYGEAIQEPSLTKVTIYNGDGFDSADFFNEFGSIKTTKNNDDLSLTGYAHILTFNLPIGIEVNLLEKLKFRLGSNSLIPLYANTNFKFTNTNQPSTVTTEYTHGDDKGTIKIEEESISSQTESTQEVELTSLNYNFNNNYNMGIGWEISENIKLDIIHFMKITDLNTWKLSLVVKL